MLKTSLFLRNAFRFSSFLFDYDFDRIQTQTKNEVHLAENDEVFNVLSLTL